MDVEDTFPTLNYDEEPPLGDTAQDGTFEGITNDMSAGRALADRISSSKVYLLSEMGKVRSVATTSGGISAGT